MEIWQGLNFWRHRHLAIAPASSARGEFDSVIMFNTALAVSSFNTTYGAGGWTISGIKLSLGSNNFGTQGAIPNNNIFNTINAGSFGIDWLAGDSWVEGSGGGNGTSSYPNNSMVTYDDIANLLSPGFDPLGDFTYTPPGNGVYENYSLGLDGNLVANATAGGNLSLYFFAADNQVSYLFDSRTGGAPTPELTLTATPTPEPGTVALLSLASGGLLALRGLGRKA